MAETPTPIFYEALAAVAHCTPDEAADHYLLTAHSEPRGRAHPVEAFLEDYTGAGR